jgi:hypothetical protein
MINYEGIEYNFDIVVQFQTLKKLLEALCKKQIDHNIILFGQDKNIVINNNEDNIANNGENINVNDKKENKTEENNPKSENDNKNISTKNEETKMIEKINNYGLIKELVDSQKKLIEHQKLIDELRARIEALESEKSNMANYVFVNKGESNKDINNNIDLKKSKNDEIEDNIDINENENEENLNDGGEGSNNNNNLNANNIESELHLKELKEQIEKIQFDTKTNTISIDSSKNEISNFKETIKKLNEQINLNEQKRKKESKKEGSDSLASFEKKILKIIELKFKELSLKKDNTISKELNSEKEKLKENSDNIFNELKKLEEKDAELEAKIKDMPPLSELTKVLEKVKLFEMDLEDYPSKKDFKHLCDEMDKYENELSKLKMFTVSQNDINSKFREDILKIKNNFDNIKKTFSSITKLFENNNLTTLLDNLNDLSNKMVDREDFNKFIKEINKTILDIRMDVNDHNRSLDQIMPMIQKILTMEDLKKLESSLIELIEKQNALSQGKFADKKEIIKSIKSIEAQVKLFMDNLDKEREKEKNDGCILASRPVGGYKCASCEAYIGDLKESTAYLPWNKIHGFQKPYRLGSSFSRILQGLNLDNTFNPFLQKNLLRNEGEKKYKLSNESLSVKKVRKIPPLDYLATDNYMIKDLVIDEPHSIDNSNYYYSTKGRFPQSRVNLNKTLRTLRNDANLELRNVRKDTSFNSNNNQQNHEVVKSLKISKKTIQTKVSNSSEDPGNRYFMPNL